MLKQLGHRSGNTQRFWGCDNTNAGGVLGVLVNGAYTAGSALAAATDYTGTIDAEVPTSAYTWQLCLDGSPVGESVVAPANVNADGSTTVLIWGDGNSIGSCWDAVALEPASYSVCLGDRCYIDEAAATAGGTVAAYRAEHRKLYTYAGRAKFYAAFPAITMWDNHESVGVTGYSPGDARYDAAKQAMDEYAFCLNPTDVAAQTASGLTPATYLHTRFGAFEFITMDHISRAVDRNTPAALKVDAAQLAWFAAACAAAQISESKVVVICSPTQPKINNDWAVATAGSIFHSMAQITGKTVVLFTADSHGAFVVYRIAGGAYSGGEGYLEVQATPFHHDAMSATDGMFTGTTTEYLKDNNTTYTQGWNYNYNYALVTWNPSANEDYTGGAHLKISVRSAWSRLPRWECVIPEGLRAPTVLSRNKYVKSVL